MQPAKDSAEVNIHLRARAQERDLIDRAAGLAGLNRSQFMLGSAVQAARNMLLDQTTLHADARQFQKILAWLDLPPSPDEQAGMARLLGRTAGWARD